LRDRDVMNLLDQLELFTLDAVQKEPSQKDYWFFVYKSMKSGLLMTKNMERYLRYKLNALGVQV
jgi:hypothetical protein